MSEAFEPKFEDDELITQQPDYFLPDLDEAATSADLVRVYLNEIGKTALLTAEDEVDLSKRIEAGLYATHLLGNNGNFTRHRIRELQGVATDGEEAKDIFLRANLRLVVSLAKRYTGHGMPFLDIIQEGNLGLIRAVEKFDYQKGYKFSTYATWWIRQAIERGMAEKSRLIHVPTHRVEDIKKMEKFERYFLSEQGREPTIVEIAKFMDIEEKEANNLREYSRREPVSLNERVGPAGDAELGDFVSENYVADTAMQEVEVAQLRTDLLTAINSSISERRLRRIVKMRFGLDDGTPKTLRAIAEELGITVTRVQQLAVRGTQMIQGNRDFEYLRDYLEG